MGVAIMKGNNGRSKVALIYSNVTVKIVNGRIDILKPTEQGLKLIASFKLK